VCPKPSNSAASLDRLIVCAVEAADVGYGTDLSPEVAAALPELLDAILIDLDRN
jgi:hydrogenase maturation protease